jgi:hypothetical protein
MNFTDSLIFSDPLFIAQLGCLVLLFCYIIKLMLSSGQGNHELTHSNTANGYKNSRTMRTLNSECRSSFDVGKLISLPKDYLRYQIVG